MKTLKNMAIYYLMLFIVLVNLTGCFERQLEDLHYEGMDVFYNYYNIVPNDSVPNNLLSSDDSNNEDIFLQNYPYIGSQFHFFMKNYGKFITGDYSLTIMVLNYDSKTYANAKSALLNNQNMNYTTDSAKLIYNGYEFYERYLQKWSDDMDFIYHAFCDEKSTIVLMNYCSYYNMETLKSYIERDDFIGFFKKYYGDFYNFDE